MKRLVFVLAFAFLLSGCAVVGYTSYIKNDPAYDYASDPNYPPGKTDEDWVKEEKQCQNESGRVPGFLGLTLPGIISNAGGANERYNACMKRMGWLK